MVVFLVEGGIRGSLAVQHVVLNQREGLYRNVDAEQIQVVKGCMPKLQNKRELCASVAEYIEELNLKSSPKRWQLALI